MGRSHGPPFMKLRISQKAYVVLGLVLLVALAGVPLLNAELRSFVLFKLTPAYARDMHFLRLECNDQVVYLLGTIHTAHHTSEAYSLWHLEAIMEHLKHKVGERPSSKRPAARPAQLSGRACQTISSRG